MFSLMQPGEEWFLHVLMKILGYACQVVIPSELTSWILFQTLSDVTDSHLAHLCLHFLHLRMLHGDDELLIWPQVISMTILITYSLIHSLKTIQIYWISALGQVQIRWKSVLGKECGKVKRVVSGDVPTVMDLKTCSQNLVPNEIMRCSFSSALKMSMLGFEVLKLLFIML